MKRKFEHKMQRYEPDQIDKAFEAINTMGDDGWELVNGQPVVEPRKEGGQMMRIYLFWKREVE